MNDNLRRALQAMEAGVDDVRDRSAGPASDIRRRLRRALAEAQAHLDTDEAEQATEPADVFSRLDRQSKDIAEDLRRIERLMRERGET